MAFNKAYGECTGPFGFPMQEEDARELDDFLKEHSKDSALGYKHKTLEKGFEYFIDGERADVSVVTASTIDLDNEIVMASGGDWSAFEKRRNVTLNHNYWMPPVGKALWWKQVKDVWKAKTQYLSRPESLPQDKEWVPDTIFDLVKQGGLPGKSIGFIPTKWHEPTREEVSKDFNLKNVDLIFDEWKIYEYAVAYIQSNTDSVVEAVSSMKNFKGFHDEQLCSIFSPVMKKLNENKKPKQDDLPEPKEEEKISVKGISAEEFIVRRKSVVDSHTNQLAKAIPEIVKQAIDKYCGKV